MSYRQWSLRRGRQSCTFLGPVSWGIFHGCSSGNLDQHHNPSSCISFLSILSLGGKISRDGLFLGECATILQMDSWPLWLQQCCQAMPSLVGSAVVPPCSLAGSWPGVMLLPVCTVGGWQMSTSARSTHPKMAEEKEQEISCFRSCKAEGMKFEICACFLFFSNAWLWPRISYRHSNLVRLMALVSLVTNATPARHLALNSLYNHSAFFKV